MRKLKFHEKKLLKKTNFLEYKREGGHREAAVTQRYSLIERDDYKKYTLSRPLNQSIPSRSTAYEPSVNFA